VLLKFISYVREKQQEYHHWQYAIRSSAIYYKNCTFSKPSEFADVLELIDFLSSIKASECSMTDKIIL